MILVHMSLVLLRGGVVPTNYLELDYIESNGSQYIDTGIYAEDHTIIRMGFTPTYIPNDWAQIFGARNNYHSTSAIQLSMNSGVGFGVDIGTGSAYNTDSSGNTDRCPCKAGSRYDIILDTSIVYPYYSFFV